MLRVYKYPLPSHHGGTVVMPRGAKAVHFDNQGGTLTVWALVDPYGISEERFFHVAATGGDVHPSAVHRGTMLHPPGIGELVLHLFEIVRPTPEAA